MSDLILQNVPGGLPTTFENAGIGFFSGWYGQGVPPFGGGSGIGLALSKLIYATTISLPITIRKITFTVNAAVAASKVYVALYDSTGTLVPNSSNGGASGVSTGLVTTTLGTPFTINPGLYYVWVNADTTGITLDGQGSQAGTNNLMNKNVVRMGTSANGITGAAAPATLGVLTAASQGVVNILFEA